MRLDRLKHHVVRIAWPNGTIPAANRLETEASKERYKILGTICEEYDVSTLFTGHHLGDAVETMLYRISRSSGLYGLSGLLHDVTKEIYTSNSEQPVLVRIVRPFMTIPKHRLEATCRYHGLSWVQDPSNEHIDVFRRNQIRFVLGETSPVFNTRAAQVFRVASTLRQDIDRRRWLIFVCVGFIFHSAKC